MTGRRGDLVDHLVRSLDSELDDLVAVDHLSVFDRRMHLCERYGPAPAPNT